MQSVTDVLQQTGLDPKYLELEITEGILMGTDDRTVETMKALRKLGIKLALDDFGTGFFEPE
ncbi:EAL domain-containing protein [Undibacterium arcticum]